MRTSSGRLSSATAARAARMAEAAWIGAGLAQRGLRVEAVVANRLTPGGPGAPANAGRGPGRVALQRNLDQLRALAGDPVWVPNNRLVGVIRLPVVFHPA